MLQATLAVLLLGLAPVTPASAQQPADCPDKCGDISVPYPFGIGANCARDSGFQLECNHTYNPPRLFMSTDPNPELVSLSLHDGEARFYNSALRNCYNSSGGLVSTNVHTSARNMEFGSAHPYRLSSAKNRLVALGCPNIGFLLNPEESYAAGCISVCESLQSTGPCAGVGCCQSSIPPGLYGYWIDQRNIEKSNGAVGWSEEIFTVHTNCNYAFLVDAEWFNSSYLGDFNRTDNFTVPIVVDWAIRDYLSDREQSDARKNCIVAKRNATEYACRSRFSECFDSTNGPGYRCKCSEGYEGNPYLDDGCKDINECERKDKYPCHGKCTNTQGNYTCECPPGMSGNAKVENGCRKKDKFTIALKILTGVGAGIFMSVYLLFWLYLGLQKRKLIRTKQKFFEQNGGVILQQQIRSYGGDGGGVSGFKIFSKEDLQKATDDFAADRILGRGGYGVVYKGVLVDNTVVAIKKSKMMEETQTKEFAREMFILSQINHRNVVKLLGCCLEVEVPMLVYEFVSNGTLYHYIHGTEPRADIALDSRLRIAAESAQALSYMHSSASPPILHGDVKTANILLDDKLSAKVSDFGTSKLAPTDEVEIATLVQGTCGYLDPEYLMTCHLTDKSDVYSFGVVVLELLTRKKALYMDGPEEDRCLASCFTTAVKAGRHRDLLDSQVRNEMSEEMIIEIVHLLMGCLSMTGEERPTMKEVAERLEMLLRTYQQHPWTEAEVNEDESRSLLSMEQRDAKYQLNQSDVLDLEEGSTYTFSL